MKTLESLSLHLTPLVLVLALAVVTKLSPPQAEHVRQASYAAASPSAAVPRTPYGSSAAVRALLF